MVFRSFAVPARPIQIETAPRVWSELNSDGSGRPTPVTRVVTGTNAVLESAPAGGAVEVAAAGGWTDGL